MIWHLHIAWDGYRFDTPGQEYTPAKSRVAVARPLRAGAARPLRTAHILASQRRGAKGIVTLLGGVLT